MFKACCSRDSPTTLCHKWLRQRSCDIINGSKSNFGRICSITNAFIKGGNRCFGNFLGFSWLWGHFQCLGFGIQGTISRICGDEKKFSVFGDKTRYFVFSLGGSKFVYFNDSFNQPPIKIWKKLQILQQHAKNDHINRRKTCQEERF